ncbi:MAG: dTDP-4-dehydrorhamnose 3,5-epimerase family protein [Phenylobacterium sp.]|uniref:dTDP-4-dehydrorhamnose 3,5-epimerase family protein n=1 Tax=Phenylobacterium sp. TaxID=1871053 RepID=UPI0025D75260|nr:dTDP-4-dehydrorhamnose 3,5-epimerase family protein [Phenylobacterium sp.]MCA6257387.1 dTDP-4-dehydrorhamnose 3,5-epimerase family protein [Phenylobacterium sp.]
MRFSPTPIAGAVVVDIDPVEDERGGFARLFCPRAFAAAGHPFSPAQTSLSRNRAAFTLRGMHFQPAPFDEGKLVRVTRGRIFDVVVDLRPKSPTFRQWTGVELSAETGRALLIGRGLAHGFLTLEADTDVHYEIDRFFEPGKGEGVRWNDPAFGIAWPAEPRVMSDRDAAWPDFSAA